MSTAQWEDLAPRLSSAAVMLVVAGLALWAGGAWFVLFTAACVGLMVWELARMVAPDAAPGAAIQSGALAGGTLAVLPLLPSMVVLPFLAAALIVIHLTVGRHPALMLGYAAAIWLAGLALIDLRLGLGAGPVLFLVAVVIVTDVSGYFAGRILGGPKFWPRVSPKKTWSGTAAGWVGAGFVGLAAMLGWEASFLAIPAAVILSFASQMGDIAESALKRKMGVKDSSALIPGHGGVLDRMDGMLGAVLVFWVLRTLVA